MKLTFNSNMNKYLNLADFRFVKNWQNPLDVNSNSVTTLDRGLSWHSNLIVEVNVNQWFNGPGLNFGGPKTGQA